MEGAENLRIINLETVLEIISELEEKLKEKGFRLETEIIEKPRIILDILSVLKFRKDNEVLIVSLLGEYGDDIMLIIVARDEVLKERQTIFKQLDDFDVENFLNDVLIKEKQTSLSGCLFSLEVPEHELQLLPGTTLLDALPHPCLVRSTEATAVVLELVITRIASLAMTDGGLVAIGDDGLVAREFGQGFNNEHVQCPP